MAKDVGRGQQKIVVLKRRRIIFVTLLALTAFSSMLVALSLASFLPELTIESVRVEGVQKERPDAIKAFAEVFSANNILGFFSGRNVFLCRPNVLENLILKSFPRIQSVDVARDSLTSVVLRVKERTVSSLWCPDVIENDKCINADEDGFLFSPLETLIASGNNLVVFNTPHDSKTIGDYIVPSNRFREFGYFLRQMNSLGLMINSFVIADDSITLYIDKGGKLILDTNQDLTKAELLIESLKNNKELGFGTDAFMKNLDYFDLRYTGKAIYKMKNSSTKSSATSTVKNF